MEDSPIFNSLTLTSPPDPSTSPPDPSTSQPSPTTNPSTSESEPNKQDYTTLAFNKRKTLTSLIPSEWRLPTPLPSAEEVPNVTKYARKFLSEREVKITEGFTAEELCVEMESGTYSAVEVVGAFGRRAGVAGQLVGLAFV